MDGQKNEGAKKKRSSKTIDIVSYALKVSGKWCQMCVCSPFQVIRHNLKVYKLA